jgi:predicted nucleic acid-binding protein
MKFYLDTSVFGGLFDKEFRIPTKKLFDFIEDRSIKLIYSDIIEKELETAPEHIRLQAISTLLEAEHINLTEEMSTLAEMYIKEGALTKKSSNDAEHIAIATIVGATAIISWNFKHMANFIKIQQYNTISLREGYRLINIHTPMEITDYEKTTT